MRTFSPVAVESSDVLPIEFRDGERVNFIGGTLIEREQRYGYWEHALTAAHPDKQITFRNLGWSGDTVWAESRGIFDPPAKGYERLVAQVRELDPTLLVFNYGGNEAWESFASGEPVDAAIGRFLAQYAKLIDDVTPKPPADGTAAATTTLAPRVVLLTPLPLEKGVGPNADPGAFNAHLAHYTAAIQKFADDRGYPCLDLSAVHQWYQQEVANQRGLVRPLTQDGQQLSEYGYWRTANWLRDQLCGDVAAQTLRLPPLEAAPMSESSPEQTRSRELLAAIRTKNELYFHRWRPQNVTYLFLFRKHEQGQNAAEIPKFDPLVAEQERIIHQLIQP
ncbi:MAG: GDSL-type esterase/lipase family protein [Planctomycetaceae bacterium]